MMTPWCVLTQQFRILARDSTSQWRRNHFLPVTNLNHIFRPRFNQCQLQGHRHTQPYLVWWRRFVPPGPADRLRCAVVATFLLKSLCVTSVPATFLCAPVWRGSQQRLAEPVTPLSVLLSSFSARRQPFFDFGSLLVDSLNFSLEGEKGSPSSPTPSLHFWFCLCHLHKRVQRDCRGWFLSLNNLNCE